MNVINSIVKRKIFLPLCAAFLFIVLLAYPYMVDPEESFIVYFLFMSFIYITLSQGWNVVAGYTGQVSLGQHAFFGLGAYITAISWKTGLTGYLDPLAMAMSGFGAALLAVIVGFPLLAKLRGDYFALGTLGLGEILRVIFTQGGTITGGPVGLMLPSGEYLSLRPYYYIALGFASLSFVSIWFLIKSRFGLAMLAVREDEQAAASSGINTLNFKVFGFALGALLTGLCGSLYAYYLFHIHPSGFFSLNWSLLPVLMTVLGGVGTLAGPIIGPFILAVLFELANIWLPEIHPIFSGVFIIVVMLFLPKGLMSLKEKAGRSHSSMLASSVQ